MDIWDIIGREQSSGEEYESEEEIKIEPVTYNQLITALSNSILLKKCYRPPPSVEQAIKDLNRILNSQKVRGWTLRRKAGVCASEFE